MISTRSGALVIDTVVCLTLAKWETVSGRFGGYLVIRSNMMLLHERNNKLLKIEAMAASIAHELKQPMAAIAINGSAALRFLGRGKPDLEEVREAEDGKRQSPSR